MSEKTFEKQLNQMLKNLEQYRTYKENGDQELDRIIFEVKIFEKALPNLEIKDVRNVISHMALIMWNFYNSEKTRKGGNDIPSLWRVANGDMNHLRVFLNMERI